MSSQFNMDAKMSEKMWKEIPVASDVLTDTDRKITRNQKRRHDEINHVQKTLVKLTRISHFPINTNVYYYQVCRDGSHNCSS